MLSVKYFKIFSFLGPGALQNVGCAKSQVFQKYLYIQQSPYKTNVENHSSMFYWSLVFFYEKNISSMFIYACIDLPLKGQNSVP